MTEGSCSCGNNDLAVLLVVVFDDRDDGHPNGSVHGGFESGSKSRAWRQSNPPINSRGAILRFRTWCRRWIVPDKHQRCLVHRVVLVPAFSSLGGRCRGCARLSRLRSRLKRGWLPLLRIVKRTHAPEVCPWTGLSLFGCCAPNLAWIHQAAISVLLRRPTCI